MNPKPKQPIYKDPPHYCAFLLTAWEERGQEPADAVAWRFSLEDTRTNRRRGFATLDELVEALKTLLENAAPAESGENAAAGPARGPPG